MSGQIYYTGTQSNIIAANDQIDSNCGFPDGYTQTWATPQKAYQKDFWFIKLPPAQGYREPNRYIDQDTMINGVVNVEIQESQRNWWPPFPPGS